MQLSIPLFILLLLSILFIMIFIIILFISSSCWAYYHSYNGACYWVYYCSYSWGYSSGCYWENHYLILSIELRIRILYCSIATLILIWFTNAIILCCFVLLLRCYITVKFITAIVIDNYLIYCCCCSIFVTMLLLHYISI